jgi:hypothetical protein
MSRAMPYTGDGSALTAQGLPSLDDAELAGLVRQLDEALSALLGMPLSASAHERAAATLHYVRGHVHGRLS